MGTIKTYEVQGCDVVQFDTETGSLTVEFLPDGVTVGIMVDQTQTRPRQYVYTRFTREEYDRFTEALGGRKMEATV